MFYDLKLLLMVNSYPAYFIILYCELILSQNLLESFANWAVKAVLQSGFVFASPEVPGDSLARDNLYEISQYHDF